MPEGVETSTRTGFLIGGVLFYSFSPILGLQVEPAYVQKGAKIDIINNDEATLTANYIDIPVLLKASFGDGPVKPYLLAGATVAFKLCDAMLEFSDDTEDTVKTKSTDFILNIGGGVIIPAGKVNIFIEGQYNLGLSDLNDEPDDDTEFKSTGIQVKAGVLFPLN